MMKMPAQKLPPEMVGIELDAWEATMRQRLADAPDSVRPMLALDLMVKEACELVNRGVAEKNVVADRLLKAMQASGMTREQIIETNKMIRARNRADKDAA